MKQNFLFKLKKGSSLEEAELELATFINDIYEINDAELGETFLGGFADSHIHPPKLKHVDLENASFVDEINWEEQWSKFSPDFYDGVAHLNLPNLKGKTILLKPGHGFGDYSHPTTRLVIELMMPYVKEDTTVYDIGCGSGILSIAAAFLHAKFILGIDIDPLALQHAKENAKLNHLTQKQIRFSEKIKTQWLFKAPSVILMNMIETQQHLAWQSVTKLHHKKATLITSGILTSQVDRYLNWTAKNGWNLLKIQENGEWAGFVFESL